MFKNVLYSPIYFSWTNLRGGRRVHFPVLLALLAGLDYVLPSSLPMVYYMLVGIFNSAYLTKVDGRKYFIVGILFMECKLYVAPRPTLPEITSEELMERNVAILHNAIRKHKSVGIKTLSKKMKLSSSGVEQLALSEGYIIENDMIFLK